MTHDTWQQRYQHAITPNYGMPKRQLVRGAGCRVWDSEGVEYLDFLAGIAVNSLGHAHPVLVEAVSAQIATLSHVSNYYTTPAQLALAEKLLEISGAGPAGRVFIGNSGTEANEAALKMARLHKPGGRVIALDAAFHGRTYGSLSLTGKAAMREQFAPVVPNIQHIDRTVEALEAAFADDVAAIFIEPILGEAGVVELPEGFLLAARALATRHGALLILDEVQTGIARTGSWYHFQQVPGLVPDIVTTAKGIAGGVPLSAVIAFEPAAGLLLPGTHGSTYGGNPLAATAALAVLAEIERADLIANALARGAQLRAAIEGLGSALIAATSGSGLLVGVVLTEPRAAEIADAALAAGLIINAAAPDRLRIAPPLIVTEAEIDEAVGLLSTALESITEGAHP